MRTLFIALVLGIAIAYIRTNKKLPRQYLTWSTALLLMIWIWPQLSTKLSEYQAQHVDGKKSTNSARLVEAKAHSTDTTFYITVTQEWSDLLVTELDQCLHIKNMEPVAYEEMFDDGSTVFFPKVIEPFKTKVQILDRKGRVVETLTADKYGRFTIIGRRGRQLRVLGAESVVFQIRRTES